MSNVILELTDITKVYDTASEQVHALKGINLKFRKNEFVSVLGPSGCGKTTMLNIIGGLDQYTSGDLLIDGISTKEYKDRNWDNYRNNSIGFVFQVYNLIPHQTVLSNVELALTLAGVEKKERKERAIKALEMVGLGNQLRKRPAQLSGGQMQRVAIARAIVNNPEIVLADEPTGALDTETSKQVMDILKEIAKDRLVIMVTHNPDLASHYSTRIVRMIDGLIVSDSNPINDNETENVVVETNATSDANVAKATMEKPEQENTKKEKRAKRTNRNKKVHMSFFTSFALSLRNLFTKRGRTILTSFAGSIGIIGIALIYAVSKGTTNYIDLVQEQTLSSYPIQLQSSVTDMSSLLSTFLGRSESVNEHENDAVYQKAMIYQMLDAMNTMETRQNDLESFKVYLENELSKEDSKLNKSVSAVQYSYNYDFAVYTENVDGKIMKSDMIELMVKLIKDFSGIDYTSLLGMSGRSQSNAWSELIPGTNGELINKAVKDQYDIIYGSWPNAYNEVVLFVDEKNEIQDLALYALGLVSIDEISEIANNAVRGEHIQYEIKKWTYQEICNMTFKTILNANCYNYSETSKSYVDLRETQTGLKYLYEQKAIQLKVVGIARPSENKKISNNSSSSDKVIGYTSELTKYVINESMKTDIVKKQLEDTSTDVFTGLPFKQEDNTVEFKARYFDNYVDKLDTKGKADLYKKIKCIPDEDIIRAQVDAEVNGKTREEIEDALLAVVQAQMPSMDQETVKGYLHQMSENDLRQAYGKVVEEYVRSQYVSNVMASFEGVEDEVLATQLDNELPTYTNEQKASYYDQVLEFSSNTLGGNLYKLGCVDLESPSSINLYASSFENKEIIEDEIARYNNNVEEKKQIEYTDYVGLIMSSITTILNAITYVLIAFVSVSLVVSSIMIGVITLISVQERTKEIGILRAIGASKGNVSSLFNAETIIIGFTSGLFGVLITYLLCIPINIILHVLTDIKSLNATLPILTAIILIAISTMLTLIAGIIPSRSAAKKDPVVALRTE